MTTETGVPAGSDAAPANDTSELTLEDARNLIYAEEPPAESAEIATATKELPDEGDAGPEEAPGEDEGNDPDAEKLPPIERPRSWSKDDDDEWNALPRARQEKFVANERVREADIAQRISKAAEATKAADAKAAQADQARQQFEAKLNSTVKIMEDALQADFGDIQTMQNVRDLQANDPFRFQAWQVRQMELTAAKSEQFAAEQRQAQEKQSKRADYEAEQNALLIKFVPEMANPKKASELRTRVVAMLNDDLGLKTDLLGRWMQDDTGHEILSNAGIQKLMTDGLKYRDIQNAPKAVADKPIPPVQRPGVARPAGAADSENIQALDKRLTQTGSEKDAWALYEARLKSQSRRAS